MAAQAQPATFYYDLVSPLAYIAAERLVSTLGIAPAWQPVLARELPSAEGFDSFRCAQERTILLAEIERRARTWQLQPLRWPEPFPFDSELAMRVATYAQSIGRVAAFSLAAFRQAFAAGHSLEDPDFVLIAAAACELHPAAVLAAARRPSLGQRLRSATAQAAADGVSDVPAIRAGGHTFVGERALEQAAELLAA